MKVCFLKHKDNIAAEILFNEVTGGLESVISVVDEKALPICSQDGHTENLEAWWYNRAVPRSRSDIRKLLDREHAQTSQSLLFNNLGLSMTDAFWVCPAGHDIKWKDVSFHLNPPASGDQEMVQGFQGTWWSAQFTPAASTGGELRKNWTFTNGRFELLKGNLSAYYFQQSLNEVIASKVHEAQGYDNYVPYHLVRFRDGSMGCACPCFTNEHVELVPAWELFAKHRGEAHEGSMLDAYVSYAEVEGFDRQRVRNHIDYMFTTDFLLSNTDRHSSNHGLLRNSDSLEAIGPAPVFDTGNSMFHLGGGISSFHDLFHLRVSSLYDTEDEIMDNVRNPSLVDISKLPSKEEILSILKEDPVVAPSAERLYSYFEFKANIILARQRGLTMRQIEDRIASAMGDDEERTDINKAWAAFWGSLEA